MMQIAGLSVAFNAKPKVRDEAQLVISSNNLEELVAIIG
jgi:phosphoserine phosphatase